MSRRESEETLRATHAWLEDDIQITANIPSLSNEQHGWNSCCRQLAHTLKTFQWWQGLRASDLDQLQRRQKAAEWSNVISDGPDWASAAGSGAASTATSDAFDAGMDAIELDEFGEDDFLTARSDHNRSNAGSGLAGPSNASAGMGHLLQTATHDAAGGLAPAMPATCSPVHHVPQRQPAADGSVQGAADGEGTREGTNPFRKGSGSGRLSDPPPPPDEDSAQPAQVQHA